MLVLISLIPVVVTLSDISGYPLSYAVAPASVYVDPYAIKIEASPLRVIIGPTVS